MKILRILKKVLFRIMRILIGRKGVYCKMGKKNHVSSGTILYEGCVIGKYNYFAPYTLAYNAKIGNYCSIGPGCKIGLADHDVEAISTRSTINNGCGEMQMFNRPAIIGSDVWLGSNVVVKQGVKIGSGSIIGANAVVTKDIPEYAIAVGIPAKVVRYRFSEDKITRLLQSNWFSYDIKEARKIVQDMSVEYN